MIQSRGIDVSSYQRPLDWQKARTIGFEFAIVRLVRRGIDPDEMAMEHIRRARAAGLRVGGYHFFHPGRPVETQLAVLRAQMATCGIGPGDIAPALDLESFTGNASGPSWVPGASEMLASMRSEYGSAIRYHNVTDYLAMGRPAWSAYPLWLAAYRSVAPPPMTCGTPVLWQHASAMVPALGMVLDQNVALGSLPTIPVRPDAIGSVELTDDLIGKIAVDGNAEGLR